MRRNQVNTIASLITEDPDIFVEIDASMDASIEAPPEPGIEAGEELIEPEQSEKPLNATEIEQEADIIAGDDAGNVDAEIAGELQDQQDAELAAEQERRALLEPQLDELGKLGDSIGTGITQGQVQAGEAQGAFGGLDKDMAMLQTLIANLGKSML